MLFCGKIRCSIKYRVLTITFFVPYKRAGTHFSIHPAKRQYTPPSKKELQKPKNQNTYILPNTKIKSILRGIYITQTKLIGTEGHPSRI